MGAVLAYRALYYLLPLAGGLVLYLFLERYAASHPGEAAADEVTNTHTDTDSLTPPRPAPAASA
jgi:hypothetical protein